ncbi:hypothetical protein EJ08DRAFT_697270 [Tothia fuscella]|uniref:Meiotic expression up-regulated protein 6 PH domain-containing protein n=1 Tax=Tothia fuscella TaxID=1048955 RepID=A0A9P4NSP5_9PEZI|nr:hypothetical protein EJ08DRAFT_697270 [Tothia fuscella]
MSTTIDAKTVTETPAAPVVEPTPAPLGSTETPATTGPINPEPAPVEGALAKTVETTAEPITAVEEPKKEEKTPAEPKYEGQLAYQAPSNFLRELLPLPPKKQFFWFGTEPVASQELNHYLAKGKEAAHSTAAWASQTGTGLLYFNKHGEKKDSPTGVLNLADAEDIKSSGLHEISFKLHNHKHRFEAPEADRDSWLAAFKKVAAEAKEKKEEIVNSEGYKEALTKLRPAAAVIAPVSAAKTTEAAPKKSIEAKDSLETPTEAATEESKKTNKSRSRSRGAPSNIIGFFNRKKEDAKPESKKEEPVATETAATESVATEPVAETTTAPVITDAVPPVDDKKVDEPIKDGKTGRRQSRFESFFSPKAKTTEKAPETTREPVEPISDSAPKIEEPVAESTTGPILPVEPIVDAPTEAAERKEGEITPTKERKPSLLAGVKSFTQKLRSPSSEHPPALAPETIAETTPATTETADTSAIASETPATAATTEATDAPATNGESRPLPGPSEKRRSSFFSSDFIKNMVPKNEKKVEPTANPFEEPAKPSEAVEEPIKPVDETPAVAAVEPEAKKSTEVKSTEPKVEKERKESPIATLTRRVSKAIRGDKAKRETKPVPKVDEAGETGETAPKLPETHTEPSKVSETDKENTAPNSIGDAVPEAVNVGTAHKPNATVSATA